ncbi:hypothetical protein [Wenjunlia tyrosinilytica]|uniref:Choice-of-anchor G family protein n=1 Tax=Wenjunlia tyrosinilytica TaxID=1544741 RepID=A0A917ZTW0_9ACTN|nr:hypothetical protein [Wenjunlia tyrosinilytica]GGO91762.1 hypothetical protein GCM10012280_40390 [Wenjunlia tyrosinilytica]
MSHAARTNKRRVLGASLASAALISAVAATGAAMAGEGGNRPKTAADACSSGNEKSSDVVVTAGKDISFGFNDLAKALAFAGAQQQSLNDLGNALRALPASQVSMVIDNLDLGAPVAPKVKVTAVDSKAPGTFAQGAGKTGVQQMNAQLAAVNKGLSEIWSDTGGLKNIQAALGGIALNNAVNIGDIDLDFDVRKGDDRSGRPGAKSLAKCAQAGDAQ